MKDAKRSAQEITRNELSSKPSGDVSTADQHGSTNSVYLKPAVEANRTRISEMTPRQADRRKIGAKCANEPLEYAGHEALAQFLAYPEPMKVFKSLTALAKHYGVTRMTVHRWRHSAGVLQRAEWLSKGNRLAGVLAARSNWERVVQAQVTKAITGDTQAARFLNEIAWSDDTLTKDSPKDIKIRVVYDDMEPMRNGVSQETASSSEPAGASKNDN
jgi:hypothetical protein